MRRIGLTGGIATGKSYVAARLRAAGIPVVDADLLAREAVAPGSDGLAAVVARFGRGVLQAGGVLDRQALADVVFRDAAARRDLEAIVHPRVRAATDRFFATLPAATAVAVADIPLLFEAGRARDFDEVVVVACDPHTQVARVMARDAASRQDAERRIAAQWPIAEKMARADHVIRTDGTFADTDAQVEALVRTWLAPGVSGVG